MCNCGRIAGQTIGLPVNDGLDYESGGERATD